MNKHEYKKLLQIRNDQEKLFYELIKVTGKTPREIINTLGINHKRAWYLLTKYPDYNWGVTLDMGWIENIKQ